MNAGVEKREKSLKTSEPGCGEELGQTGFRDTTHSMVLSCMPYPVPTAAGGGTLVPGFPAPAPSHQAGQPADRQTGVWAGSGQASLAATAPASAR